MSTMSGPIMWTARRRAGRASHCPFGGAAIGLADQLAISSSNGTALSVTLALLEHEVGDVVLDHDRLDFGQAAAVAQVPAHHLGRLLVALRQLLDVRLQLLGLGLQVVGSAPARPTTRPRRTRRSACGWNISAGIGALSASLTPRFFRSARAPSTMRSVSPATQRLRQVELGGLATSASITACLVARQHAELDFALEVLA